MNGFAINDGLYSGEFKMCVDNPVQCAPLTSGYSRIINLENSNILYQGVILRGNEEIVLEEKICQTNGNNISCPDSNQEIDFSQWGLNALLINMASHGTGVMESDTKFIMHHSVRRNLCYGKVNGDYVQNAGDCYRIEEWMGANFPCMIGPWITEFTLIGE